MADNFTVAVVGGNITVGADEIAAVKYERIKLIHGADGTNDGDVSTVNGFPVQVVAALPAGTNLIGYTGAAYASGSVSNADVDSLEDVAEIIVNIQKTLGVSFTVGAAALTAFEIAAKVHVSGDYFTLYSSGNDYNFPKGLLLACSDDLSIATVAAHWFLLDVTPFYSVRLRAAGTSSTITGHYGAK